MIIDFSGVDIKKRPNFILRNLDSTKIGLLGHIINPSCTINFNDISEFSFDYPAYDNGERLKEYDLLTSMRIIDIDGYGQFILQNPIEKNDTVKKIKTCKAYSLEYELSNKDITIEEGTYNFWNPLTIDSSILGIILSEIPSWRIGSVSSDLVGKYRTFSSEKRKIYDFIKTDLQKTYGCVFDFDTYNRSINVYSIENAPTTKAVYLSSKNLLDEIEIEENTNELVTVLDVHGADDLDIRSVNPTGSNKIYNLDSYMNESYFPSEIITKWENWKLTFESYQESYFNMSVELMMLISQLSTENAVLTDLNGELSTLENQKATLIQGAAIDESLYNDLEIVKADIILKENEINNQKETVIATIEDDITALKNQLKSINQLTAFSSFFNAEQIKILDRYFKYGSLSDPTFVAINTDNYSSNNIIVRNLESIFNLINLNSLQQTDYTSDKTFYSVRGGMIETNHDGFILDAEIIRGTLEVNSNNTFVFSLYLNNGELNDDIIFSGATLSMTGTLNTHIITSESTLQFKTSDANLYFTRDVTEYQKQSVSMELYEYAVKVLNKLSSPTFYFSVNSANFLAIDNFIEFANQFTLGEKVYLHIDNNVLEPIAMSVSIDFDDLSKFEIQFSDNYRLNDKEFTLESILDQAISSSNSLELNQYNYSNFVNSGAKTSVEQFMNSAIDAMKNNILAGENNEIKIDGTGLHCMEFDETTGTYSPEQLWIAHNTIMFTDDNWDNATIGIGKFNDKNFGAMYGIVLPALVGTLLAGQNLIIESEKQDGGIAIFKMDSDGASLHNASFNLYGETGGRIDMGAEFGIVGGDNPNDMFTYDQYNNITGIKTSEDDSIQNIDDLESGDSPNVNFWLDMNGDLYLKGIIDAVGGVFRGSLEVGGSTAFRVDTLGNLKIGGTASNPNFSVDANGNMSAKNGTFSGTLSAVTLDGRSTSVILNGDLTAGDDSSDGWIKGCGIDVNDGKFYVDRLGNVTLAGNINMSNATSITWGSENSPCLVLYSESLISKPTRKYDYYPNTSSTTWHKTLSLNDYYASYTYDGGSTWTNAILIRGSDASVTSDNVFNAITNGGTKFGVFGTEDGKLIINASFIKTGTLDASIVTLGNNEYGGFKCATGATETAITKGAKMYGSGGVDGDYYVFVSNSGAIVKGNNSQVLTVANQAKISCDDTHYLSITTSQARMAFNETHYVASTQNGSLLKSGTSQVLVMDGSIQMTSEPIIVSDKNLKNEIQYDFDKYEYILRSLKPSSFLLNSDKSGKRHFGLIAQDLAQTLKDSGFDENELAILDKSSDDYYGIRYGELIPICISSIQKLYNRIEILESKLKEM